MWHVIEAMELYIQGRICGLCDTATARLEGTDLDDDKVSQRLRIPHVENNSYEHTFKESIIADRT